MKVGDLCKVIRKDTHHPCQFENYVILLNPLPHWNWPKQIVFWEALNIRTGKLHHHNTEDLEDVS